MFTITGLEEEETKLITLSSKSTKLLISLRRENDSLFSKGKGRKNVAWKRIADQFNSTSSVKVTGEQCSNKWKKLEEKYKKVSEHNSRTGNDRKECEFQDEMTEFFGSNPKIVPAATVSSMAMEAGTADHSDDEDEELPRKTPPKKKRRRSSKSSASEMIEFLKEFKDDKRKEELEKMSLSQKMHEEKMSIMNRFLDILSKKEG